MTAETDIEPSGPLLACLEQYGLRDLWVSAHGLPTARADYYRRELLRLYVVETRRTLRSRRRAR